MAGNFVPPSFSAHFENTPPEVVYHYTTQNGLLGIVEKGEIWATKIQYMNDATEFGLALTLAREKLSALITGVDSKIEADKNNGSLKFDKFSLSELLRSISGIDNVNLFCTCFCEDGDLLSQWRGYSGKGQGYSIGFESKNLMAATTGKKFILGKCIYDPEIQRNIVSEAINYCLSSDSNNWGGHGPLATILFHCGAFFKDSSFSEEKEWRLVSPTATYDQEDIAFRSGFSLITPYYRLPILHQDALPIRHVIVGPCPHMELAKSAVTALLMRNGLRGPLQGEPNTFASKIPFRNW